MAREQTPEDIGHLAVLASDLARNITGQWIAVDGGITLRQGPRWLESAISARRRSQKPLLTFGYHTPPIFTPTSFGKRGSD
jgi:hypothetical protein